MKELTFALVILLAFDPILVVHGTNSCYEPAHGCPRVTKGKGREVWLQLRGKSTCYKISTSGCTGHGFPKLWDCLNWCVGGGD
uniref:Pancreatic trypsin inhibitor n=1 Tax=Rhipicephalus appendiculatus TaxID=34631 RepID=A0A131YV84_RHIAP